MRVSSCEESPQLATLFATFEESMCQTSGARQVVPPDPHGRVCHDVPQPGVLVPDPAEGCGMGGVRPRTLPPAAHASFLSRADIGCGQMGSTLTGPPAAKVMNSDRLGKKVRPGAFGKIKVGARECPKKTIKNTHTHKLQ